ncbi:sterol desaturase family protein [Pendulispora albinea]|uniref:Sterol desaturase family protein n=1 Tax=Pendulispora albinea TaxID=2741071 RepID=A0ABZ2LT18_9BACT
MQSVQSVPPEVERFRVEYRKANVGPHYSGWLHFAFTSVGSLAILAFAAMHVHRPSALEWLTVPIAFVFANVCEYFGHKGPMHRPKRGMAILFQRHTREHHHFFTHDAMAYQSSRDFKMVLFPPVMLFFFLGVIATPVATLLFFVASSNVAWLFVIVAMGYFLTYEWLHFVYHLDESSFVGRLPAVKVLRRHHQTHHDKALMGKWNFNITFPISDLIFGTYFHPSPSARAARAANARTSGGSPSTAPDRRG